MKNALNKTNAIILGLTVMPAVAEVTYQKPPFIKDVNSTVLNEAGNEIYIWVLAAFVVTVALFSIKPGFLALTGKWDEAKESTTQIFYGVGLGMLLGGIVFAVMGKMSGA